MKCQLQKRDFGLDVEQANNIVDGAIVVDQGTGRMNPTTRDVYPVLKIARDKKSAR